MGYAGIGKVTRMHRVFQVRKMMAVLIMVGRDQIPLQTVDDMLNLRDVKLPQIINIPAEGLYLKEVHYNEEGKNHQ